MKVFPIIQCDDVIQLGDKIRIDLSQTYVAKPNLNSEIKKIEVKPKASESFLTIYDFSVPALVFAQKDWCLDWVYADKLTGATPTTLQTITVKVTLSDTSTTTVTKDISLYTSTEDALLSSDDDLLVHEFDILKYLPDGRSSWKYVHRRAKNRIFSYLSEKGFNKPDGNPYDSASIPNKTDFKDWSMFLTLHLIFAGILNSKGDIFAQKAEHYGDKASRASVRAFRIDTDGDGYTDDTIDTSSPMLVRR